MGAQHLPMYIRSDRKAITGGDQATTVPSQIEDQLLEEALDLFMVSSLDEEHRRESRCGPNGLEEYKGLVI